MSVQTSQVRSEARGEIDKKYDSGQGGFVAVLHTLEKQFYGPESPIDAKGKILLYIRHRTLRDYERRKRIPKSEIMEATGLDKRNVERAIRALEQTEYILITRTKTGKVWSENIYELHPKRYGDDYIYRPEKPSFRLVHGGRGHKSYVKKDIHTGNRSYPHQEELPSNLSAELPSQNPVGVPSQTPVGNALKNMESLENLASKNPLKEPIQRTLFENSDFHIETEAGKKSREDAMQFVRKIIGTKFRSISK